MRSLRSYTPSDARPSAGNSKRTVDALARPPSTHMLLSRLATGPTAPTPVGVFRESSRPEYAESAAAQVAEARSTSADSSLRALLHSNPTWDVA